MNQRLLRLLVWIKFPLSSCDRHRTDGALVVYVKINAEGGVWPLVVA